MRYSYKECFSAKLQVAKARGSSVRYTVYNCPILIIVDEAPTLGAMPMMPKTAERETTYAVYVPTVPYVCHLIFCF